MKSYGVNAIDNISLVKGSRNLILSKCEMSIIPFISRQMQKTQRVKAKDDFLCRRHSSEGSI